MSSSLPWVGIAAIFIAIFMIAIGGAMITASTITIQGVLIEVHHVDDPQWRNGLTQLIFKTDSNYTAINYNNDYDINWKLNSTYVVVLDQKWNSYINLVSAVELVKLN